VRLHAKTKPTGIKAGFRRIFHRTWRSYPLIVVLAFGLMYLLQFLLAPSTNLPLGSTATMALIQGPPVLVTVRSLSLGGRPQGDPAMREARFHVEMRMRNPTDLMISGDALASYCSLLGADGVTYPSDLAGSESEATQGIFTLEGSVPREGWVVAYIPRNVRPIGVTCQIGDDVDSWLVQ